MFHRRRIKGSVITGKLEKGTSALCIGPQCVIVLSGLCLYQSGLPPQNFNTLLNTLLLPSYGKGILEQVALLDDLGLSLLKKYCGAARINLLKQDYLG